MKYFYLEQNKKRVKVTIGIEGSEFSYTQKYENDSSDSDSYDNIKEMLKMSAENDKKERRVKKIKY